jgi:hypothetical protein
LQWRDESKEQSVNITYLTSSDCQSSHANPFFYFFLGGALAPACQNILYVKCGQYTEEEEEEEEEEEDHI